MSPSSFKMESTKNKTLIDLGDGFIDCTAVVPQIAGVPFDKRAGIVADLIKVNGRAALIEAVVRRLGKKQRDNIASLIL